MCPTHGISPIITLDIVMIVRSLRDNLGKLSVIYPKNYVFDIIMSVLSALSRVNE